MKIIQLKPEHHTHVVELFNQYRIFYKQASDMKRAEEFIKARLENNESVIFVAYDDAQSELTPVGFTQLYPTYSSVRAVKNWILNDLFVKPEYRKSGVATQLIDAACVFAKDNHATFIQLETGIENVNAQRLYESLHFIKQPHDSDYLLYRKEIK